MVALANSNVQYVDSTSWGNVAAYPGAGAVAAGTLCTNTANTPALGSERVFVCTIGAVSLGTAPTFTNTKGALTQEGATGLWWQECTGQPGVNGDITNSPIWTATRTVVTGQIIYHAGTASLQIAGSSFTTAASTPTFSATAGTTSTGQDVGKWTSLGLASAFGAFAAAHKRILNADAATWQTVVPAQIMIGDDHAETQSSAMTLAGGQGTVAKPNKYLCVSHSASQPATACTTGASVATTGASSLSVNSFGYYYGITFSCAGGGANSANLIVAGTIGSNAVYFDNCTLTIASTGTANPLIGNSPATDISADFLSCSFLFGATGQSINLRAAFVTIRGGSMAASGSIPTTLLTATTNAAIAVLRDCDLSTVTGTLCAFGVASMSEVYLENCKLGAAVTMTSGTNPSPGGPIFKLHNCDSGSKNYRFYEGSYLATVQQETTIVDNTTPATDGTTQISWNIATSANAAFGQPYVSPEIAQWSDLTTGSHTATIQIAGANTLTNADIWMELEYLGNGSFPIASNVSSRVADALTATANVTTSTDSWGGSPAHTQQLSVTFSPAMKGPVKARIYVAKSSTTVYVNPVITIV